MLERTPIGESELPGQGAELVHGVEVGGRLLVRLAAGEERDPRDGSRHAGFEQADGFFGDFLNRGFPG